MTFLWPEPRRPTFGRPRPPSAAEAALAERLEHPTVLVSSGRAALRLVLAHLELGRGDLVQLPPFASHCVVDAVGRVATPAPAGTRDVAAAVVFHQWGFVHRSRAPVVIEDSADSLLEPGALFPNSGCFEVLSLPKILGAPWGGVIVCRDPADADDLARLRDTGSSGARSCLALRIAGRRSSFAARCWAGVEPGAAALPHTAVPAVLAAIDRWEADTAARRERWDRVATALPDLPAPDTGRLPTAVGVRADDAMAARLSALGFSTGVRHVDVARDQDAPVLERRFALPVHQGVNLERIDRAMAALLPA